MKIEDPQRAALASAAHTLLSSRAFLEAAAAVENNLSERWKTGADAEAREKCFFEYDGFRRIVGQLRSLEGEWTMHIEATKED